VPFPFHIAGPDLVPEAAARPLLANRSLYGRDPAPSRLVHQLGDLHAARRSNFWGMSHGVLAEHEAA
jgi:hypothetical protein